MGDDTKAVERRSQATPLAEDYLAILQGQLAQGQLGMGVGPLQREAGTAARQYLSSLQQRARPNTSALLQDETPRLINAVQARNASGVNRAAQQQREAYGAAGARFGSEIGQAEGLLRSENQLGLDQIIAELLVGQSAREQQAREFDVGAGFALDDRTLAAISNLYNQGQGNLQPFQQAAQLGILPEEIIASPGLFSQLLDVGATAAAAYATGGASLPFVNPGTLNSGVPSVTSPGGGQIPVGAPQGIGGYNPYNAPPLINPPPIAPPPGLNF